MKTFVCLVSNNHSHKNIKLIPKPDNQLWCSLSNFPQPPPANEITQKLPSFPHFYNTEEVSFYSIHTFLRTFEQIHFTKKIMAATN